MYGGLRRPPDTLSSAHQYERITRPLGVKVGPVIRRFPPSIVICLDLSSTSQYAQNPSSTPGDFDPSLRNGVMLFQQKRYAEAREEFLETTQGDPGSARLHHPRSRCRSQMSICARRKLCDPSRCSRASLWYLMTEVAVITSRLGRAGVQPLPPPGAQRVGPLGPEATFLQGLKPP